MNHCRHTCYLLPTHICSVLLCVPTLQHSRERKSLIVISREREREIIQSVDGRGGCCIARYGTCGGGGGGGGVYQCDMSKVDRIMLRFRPIAPKPAVPGGSVPENSVCSLKGRGRGKRMYVRVNKNDNNNNQLLKRRSNTSKKKSESPAASCCSGSVSGGDSVVTLSLLPETPDRKEESPVMSELSVPAPARKVTGSPIWLSFGVGGGVGPGIVEDRNKVATTAQREVVVTTYVTVECVTDTWVNGDGLGWSDEERLVSLDRDACPGFVSDGGHRVVWTNKAFREMAACGGGVGVDDLVVVVCLVRKEWVELPENHPAFTCKVRVTCGGKRKLTVPCDVWRVGGSGFAWRLDVKAALSL